MSFSPQNTTGVSWQIALACEPNVSCLVWNANTPIPWVVRRSEGVFSLCQFSGDPSQFWYVHDINTFSSDVKYDEVTAFHLLESGIVKRQGESVALTVSIPCPCQNSFSCNHVVDSTTVTLKQALSPTTIHQKWKLCSISEFLVEQMQLSVLPSLEAALHPPKEKLTLVECPEKEKKQIMQEPYIICSPAPTTKQYMFGSVIGPNSRPLLCKGPDHLLSKPIKWLRVGNIRTQNIYKSIGIWQPIPPSDDFVALGIVCSEAQPTSDHPFRCVAKSALCHAPRDALSLPINIEAEDKRFIRCFSTPSGTTICEVEEKFIPPAFQKEIWSLPITQDQGLFRDITSKILMPISTQLTDLQKRLLEPRGRNKYALYSLIEDLLWMADSLLDLDLAKLWPANDSGAAGITSLIGDLGKTVEQSRASIFLSVIAPLLKPFPQSDIETLLAVDVHRTFQELDCAWPLLEAFPSLSEEKILQWVGGVKLELQLATPARPTDFVLEVIRVRMNAVRLQVWQLLTFKLSGLGSKNAPAVLQEVEDVLVLICMSLKAICQSARWDPLRRFAVDEYHPMLLSSVKKLSVAHEEMSPNFALRCAKLLSDYEEFLQKENLDGPFANSTKECRSEWDHTYSKCCQFKAIEWVNSVVEQDSHQVSNKDGLFICSRTTDVLSLIDSAFGLGNQSMQGGQVYLEVLAYFAKQLTFKIKTEIARSAIKADARLTNWVAAQANSYPALKHSAQIYYDNLIAVLQGSPLWAQHQENGFIAALYVSLCHVFDCSFNMSSCALEFLLRLLSEGTKHIFESSRCFKAGWMDTDVNALEFVLNAWAQKFLVAFEGVKEPLPPHRAMRVFVSHYVNQFAANIQKRHFSSPAFFAKLDSERDDLAVFFERLGVDQGDIKREMECLHMLKYFLSAGEQLLQLQIPAYNTRFANDSVITQPSEILKKILALRTLSVATVSLDAVQSLRQCGLDVGILPAGRVTFICKVQLISRTIAWEHTMLCEGVSSFRLPPTVDVDQVRISLWNSLELNEACFLLLDSTQIHEETKCDMKIGSAVVSVGLAWRPAVDVQPPKFDHVIKSPSVPKAPSLASPQRKIRPASRVKPPESKSLELPKNSVSEPSPSVSAHYAPQLLEQTPLRRTLWKKSEKAGDIFFYFGFHPANHGWLESLLPTDATPEVIRYLCEVAMGLTSLIHPVDSMLLDKVRPPFLELFKLQALIYVNKPRDNIVRQNGKIMLQMSLLRYRVAVGPETIETLEKSLDDAVLGLGILEHELRKHKDTFPKMIQDCDASKAVQLAQKHEEEHMAYLRTVGPLLERDAECQEHIASIRKLFAAEIIGHKSQHDIDMAHLEFLLRTCLTDSASRSRWQHAKNRGAIRHPHSKVRAEFLRSAAQFELHAECVQDLARFSPRIWKEIQRECQDAECPPIFLPACKSLISNIAAYQNFDGATWVTQTPARRMDLLNAMQDNVNSVLDSPAIEESIHASLMSLLTQVELVAIAEQRCMRQMVDVNGQHEARFSALQPALALLDESLLERLLQLSINGTIKSFPEQFRFTRIGGVNSALFKLERVDAKEESERFGALKVEFRSQTTEETLLGRKTKVHPSLLAVAQILDSPASAHLAKTYHHRAVFHEKENDTSWMEIAEWCDSSLEKVRKDCHPNNEEAMLSAEQVRRITDLGRSCAQILCDLKDERVVFTDVKPSNLLINSGGKVKIADKKSLWLEALKWQDHYEESARPFIPFLTDAFRPPEAKNRDPKYDWYEGSLYSLGVSLLQMLTNSPSENEPISPEQVVEKLGSKNARQPFCKELVYHIEALCSAKPHIRAEHAISWARHGNEKPANCIYTLSHEVELTGEEIRLCALVCNLLEGRKDNETTLRKELAKFGSATGVTHVLSDRTGLSDRSVTHVQCPLSVCFGKHRFSQRPFAVIAHTETSDLVSFLLRPFLVSVGGIEDAKVHLGFMTVAQQTPIEPFVQLLQAGFRLFFTGFGLAGVVAEYLAVCLLTHSSVNESREKRDLIHFCGFGVPPTGENFAVKPVQDLFSKGHWCNFVAPRDLFVQYVGEFGALLTADSEAKKEAAAAGRAAKSVGVDYCESEMRFVRDTFLVLTSPPNKEATDYTPSDINKKIPTVLKTLTRAVSRKDDLTAAHSGYYGRCFWLEKTPKLANAHTHISRHWFIPTANAGRPKWAPKTTTKKFFFRMSMPNYYDRLVMVNSNFKSSSRPWQGLLLEDPNFEQFASKLDGAIFPVPNTQYNWSWGGVEEVTVFLGFNPRAPPVPLSLSAASMVSSASTSSSSASSFSSASSARNRQTSFPPPPPASRLSVSSSPSVSPLVWIRGVAFVTDRKEYRAQCEYIPETRRVRVTFVVPRTADQGSELKGILRVEHFFEGIITLHLSIDLESKRQANWQEWSYNMPIESLMLHNMFMYFAGTSDIPQLPTAMVRRPKNNTPTDLICDLVQGHGEKEAVIRYSVLLSMMERRSLVENEAVARAPENFEFAKLVKDERKFTSDTDDIEIEIVGKRNFLRQLEYTDSSTKKAFSKESDPYAGYVWLENDWREVAKHVLKRKARKKGVYLKIPEALSKAEALRKKKEPLFVAEMLAGVSIECIRLAGYLADWCVSDLKFRKRMNIYLTRFLSSRGFSGLQTLLGYLTPEEIPHLPVFLELRKIFHDWQSNYWERLRSLGPIREAATLFHAEEAILENPQLQKGDKNTLDFIELVRCIHQLRKHRQSVLHVGIVGMKKAGKSTLLEIFGAADSTASAHQRTEFVHSYKLHNDEKNGSEKGIAIIDFPGIDDNEERVQHEIGLYVHVCDLLVVVLDYKSSGQNKGVDALLKATLRSGVPFCVCLNQADVATNLGRGKEITQTTIDEIKDRMRQRVIEQKKLLNLDDEKKKSVSDVFLTSFSSDPEVKMKRKQFGIADWETVFNWMCATIKHETQDAKSAQLEKTRESIRARQAVAEMKEHEWQMYIAKTSGMAPISSQAGPTPQAAPPIPQAAPPIPQVAPPSPQVAPPSPQAAPPSPQAAPPSPQVAPLVGQVPPSPTPSPQPSPTASPRPSVDEKASENGPDCDDCGKNAAWLCKACGYFCDDCLQCGRNAPLGDGRAEHAVVKLLPFIPCKQCKKAQSELFCEVCKNDYCQKCSDVIHAKGLRKDHLRTPRT